MGSEYFSTLQFIWLNIVFFIFALFLFGVCLYACLFVRWVYKRRLRQKTDEMIDAYKNDEEKRKELELRMKRQELKAPAEEKKRSHGTRKIHIVTTPCNQVIKQKSDEYIVRQIDEDQNDEVLCIPDRQVASLAPQQPVQMAQPVQQQSTNHHNTLNQYYQQNYHPVQQTPQNQQQPQYVLVPVEMWNSQKHGRQLRATSRMLSTIPAHPDLESVATQTSDRLVEKVNPLDAAADDWQKGVDEKDGGDIELGDEHEEPDEPDEDTSDKVMKRRALKHPMESKPKPSPPIDVISEETRVELDEVIPPKSSESTSSSSPSSSSTSGSSGPMVPISNSMISPDPSEKEKNNEKEKEEDKTVSSEENSLKSPTAEKGEEKKTPSAETAKPPARPSSFPYFIDSKPAKTSKEKSTAPSAITESVSPRALYKMTSKLGESFKIYTSSSAKVSKNVSSASSE